MGDGWHPGDFKRICDRTGFAVRASDTTKQWNGLVVRKQSAEQRHPQEFVHGRSDPQRVPDPRPRQVPQFLGALTTTLSAAADAGDTTIDVESSSRFSAGDHLAITLDTGEIFRVILMDVPSATELSLTSGMPWAAAAGNMITNYSAVAAAEVD